MFKNIANIDSFLEEKSFNTEYIGEFENITSKPKYYSRKKKKNFSSLFCFIITLAVITGGVGYHKFTEINSIDNMFGGLLQENILNDVQPEATAITAANSKREVISVQRKITKPDPFLPYREISDTYNKPPKFELIEPPETADAGAEASRVMDTSVSGILYDTYSPSAIINIEGLDQLVKEGDVINNYEVISIDRTTVTVKLGSNTYKAGIGEVLTSTMNHNKVSNLDKKFGGKNGN